MKDKAKEFYNQFISEHKNITPDQMIDFLTIFVDSLTIDELIFESISRFSQFKDDECYLMSDDTKFNIVALFSEFATTSLYELKERKKYDQETYQIFGEAFKQDFEKLLKTYCDYDVLDI